MHYTVRVMHYPTEKDIIGRLRYRVFVLQLGWVPGDPATSLELDELDELAHHIGVFDNATGELVGYVRIIQGDTPKGLLLEQPAFAPLLLPGMYFDATTAEVSRLCAKPGNTDIVGVLSHLVRAIYGFAVTLHTVTLFATTNDTHATIINKAFLEGQLGFYVVSGPHQFMPKEDTYLLAANVATGPQSPLLAKLLTP